MAQRRKTAAAAGARIRMETAGSSLSQWAFLIGIPGDAALSRLTRQESMPSQKSEAMPLFSQSP